MPKPTNKAILITVAATVLGAGAGSGVTYLVMHQNESRDQKIRSAGPESSDFANSIPPVKKDVTLPTGTFSPATIALEPHKFVDREIKIRGRIAQSGSNQYSIIGQETDKPIGLRVDFSKSNIDPKTYASPVEGTKHTTTQPPVLDPITATGKLVKAEANGTTTYTFVIKSIDK